MATTWTDRLAESGVELPSVVPPVASYTPAVRTGNLVYTSGQLPIVDGELSARGKVHEGAEGVVRPDEATAAARVCALNALAAIHARGIVPTEPATSLTEWRDADPILRRNKRAATAATDASPSLV